MAQVTDKNIIQERVNELTNLLTIKILENKKPYVDLSENEKIPYRIISAEITALKSYLKGEDLYFHMLVSVDYENYAGAEGIKRAKDWINTVVGGIPYDSLPKLKKIDDE